MLEIAGMGLSIGPPSDWRVLDPYGEPEVQKQIGVYLRNDAADVEAHALRETFVTDGRGIVNVALIGRQRERVRLAGPSVEQLIRTIRFC